MRTVVVGLGVIGKRMAAAVSAQPDMTLAGVVVRTPGPTVLAQPHLPVYAWSDESARVLGQAGVPVKGHLADLLDEADVLIDCGPARTGITRLDAYRAHGDVKLLFCGGERDARLGPLVHSAVKPYATRTSGRLPSCNTTSVVRVLAALGSEAVAAKAIFLRCATDTDKAGKGITNGAVLSCHPSHHADELRALFPALAVETLAATLPMVSGHVVQLDVELRSPLSPDQLLKLLAADRRLVVSAAPTISTAEVRSAMTGLGRAWDNRYEALVCPIPTDRGFSCWLALDNEAVTIPEAVDMLRLMAAGPALDASTARLLTDEALGITGLLPGIGVPAAEAVTAR